MITTIEHRDEMVIEQVDMIMNSVQVQEIERALDAWPMLSPGMVAAFVSHIIAIVEDDRRDEVIAKPLLRAFRAMVFTHKHGTQCWEATRDFTGGKVDKLLR